jgi:hypothetical protein
MEQFHLSYRNPTKVHIHHKIIPTKSESHPKDLTLTPAKSNSEETQISFRSLTKRFSDLTWIILGFDRTNNLKLI